MFQNFTGRWFVLPGCGRFSNHHSDSVFKERTSRFVESFCDFRRNIFNVSAPQKTGNSVKATGSAVAVPTGGTNSQKKSKSQKLAQPSPAGTTPVADTPGAAAATTTPVPGETPKSAKEKSVKPEKASTKETKEKEDTFECHKPVVKEAKRAEEVSPSTGFRCRQLIYLDVFQIKKHGPVDQKRKDYKTLRYDVPSSDFDKSLGLPELEAKEKEKQEKDKHETPK